MSSPSADKMRPSSPLWTAPTARGSPTLVSAGTRPWTYAQVVASPPGSPRPRSPMTALPQPVPPTGLPDESNGSTANGLEMPALPVSLPNTSEQDALGTVPAAPETTTADRAPMDVGSAQAPPADSVRRRKRARMATPTPPPTAPVTPTNRAPPTPAPAPRSRRFETARENAAAGPSRPRDFDRATSNPFLMPALTERAPTPAPLPARGATGVRFADDELLAHGARPVTPLMDLDLPLFYQRPGGGELGVPLRELDINRARFPNALRRDPAYDLPPVPNAYTLHAGNTPGPSRPIPIRSPTPRTPATGAPSLDLSFPRDPAFEDTMALLYSSSSVSDPAYTFTPTPCGGFPEVAWQDPEALFYGLPRSRMVAMLDHATGTRLALQVFNLGFPQPAEIRSITNAIIGALQAITGELEILVVPPERDIGGDDRGAPPVTWLVLGFSEETRRRLLARGVWSCFTITFLVYDAKIRIPRLLGTVGGFAHDHNNSIFAAVRAVLGGPRVLPHILQLVATNPAFVGTRPEAAARAILNSLQVRVSLLQNGNLIAAIFIDSPTQSVGRWRDWRNVIVGLPFPSPLNSTGRFRRPAACAGCHGADHPTHLCPFPDVPGWNAPPPGTHWAHPGQTGHAGVGTGAPPPPPPPPPTAGMSYASSAGSTLRGRGRGSRSSSRASDARGKRDWRSFGDENRPY
ncbi:hypothetical protein C2E23DRAFT_862489 [Lenzites betulinus]|nr:hypothetical protein C2E23DRAFT_862489 [Lenzites betulinus]